MNSEVSHLTAEDVAAFLDRQMTAADRADAEAHLANCRQCRDELTAVHRLVRTTPIRRPLVFVPVGLVAAAAIAFAAVTLGRTGGIDDRVRTRDSGDVAVRIGVRVPADGDTISMTSPTLVWSSIAGEPTYRLTLTDASGQPLWTGTTTDTSLTPQVALQPKQTYFWYVDGLRADGRAASTGVHRFTTP